MKPNLTLLCAAFGVIWSGAVAAPLPSTGTFVYSNACKSDGGDFQGYRVTLTRFPLGIGAVVEFDDDGAPGHAKASGVQFNPATGDLRFAFLGGDGDQYAFDGVVTQEKLIGAFNAKLVGDTGFSRGRTSTLPLTGNAPKALPVCSF